MQINNGKFEQVQENSVNNYSIKSNRAIKVEETTKRNTIKKILINKLDLEKI